MKAGRANVCEECQRTCSHGNKKQRTARNVNLTDLPLTLIKHVFAFTAGLQCVEFSSKFAICGAASLFTEMPQLSVVCHSWRQCLEPIQEELSARSTRGDGEARLRFLRLGDHIQWLVAKVLSEAVQKSIFLWIYDVGKLLRTTGTVSLIHFRYTHSSSLTVIPRHLPLKIAIICLYYFPDFNTGFA